MTTNQADLKTFYEIKFSDGLTCLCPLHDVADITEGATGYTQREVQMTQAEFDALPEFES